MSCHQRDSGTSHIVPPVVIIAHGCHSGGGRQCCFVGKVVFCKPIHGTTSHHRHCLRLSSHQREVRLIQQQLRQQQQRERRQCRQILLHHHAVTAAPLWLGLLLLLWQKVCPGGSDNLGCGKAMEMAMAMAQRQRGSGSGGSNGAARWKSAAWAASLQTRAAPLQTQAVPLQTQAAPLQTQAAPLQTQTAPS